MRSKDAPHGEERVGQEMAQKLFSGSGRSVNAALCALAGLVYSPRLKIKIRLPTRGYSWTGAYLQTKGKDPTSDARTDISSYHPTQAMNKLTNGDLVGY